MKIDAAALKSRGFFQQIEQDKFSLRLCSSGGMADTALLRKAVEIADKYGGGRLHFTTRQQIEIPYIAAKNVDAVQKLVSEAGIRTFTGGPRMRTVVACVGAAICKFGQIETSEFAREIQAKHFGRELPAKMKIAITGCKNNCAKVEANDIGVRGVKHGYQLYVGGCFGHETRIGKPLLPVLMEKEKILKVIDRAIDFFAGNAVKGERLGKLLDRIGIDEFKQALEEAAQV
jgi:dissimilatory sulfite reductase (desulfoviridin) alpha/beta subunit